MTKRSLPIDVPVTSPYYDQLRSLNIQMNFVPVGSPEYKYLDAKITEMERRARQRCETNMNINVYI
jgi:hypothetical protein